MVPCYALVWNMACGFVHSKNELIVFRFLAGLGGSAPLAIGGGVISDLFNAEHRGQAIAIYSLAPLLRVGRPLPCSPNMRLLP
jgi:MFS family permease